MLKAVADPEIRRKLEELGFAEARHLGRGAASHDARSVAEYARMIQGMGIAEE